MLPVVMTLLCEMVGGRHVFHVSLLLLDGIGRWVLQAMSCREKEAESSRVIRIISSLVLTKGVLAEPVATWKSFLEFQHIIL